MYMRPTYAKLARYTLRQRVRQICQSRVIAKMTERRRLSMFLGDNDAQRGSSPGEVYDEVVEATVAARAVVPALTVDQVVAMVAVVAVDAGLTIAQVVGAVEAGFGR